jgi:hypothetical protein
MDKKIDTTEGVQYEKPQIADYGDLQELTATAKGGYTDVPLGGAIGIGMSKP